MVSFQRITLSFLLVSGALFAYLIPRESPYLCDHGIDNGRGSLYDKQTFRS